MFNFIRLKLKLQWGFNKDNNKKGTFMSTVVGLMVIAVLMALIFILTNVLSSNLSFTDKEFSIFYLSVIGFVMIAIGVSTQIKRLYHADDIKIVARFPLTHYQIYLANLILIFIDMLIYSLILFAPTMIVYGLSRAIFLSGTLEILKYLLGVLIGMVFMAMLTFSISVIIAIPVLYILTLLERKTVIKIIIFVAILIALFVLYNYILTILAKYFIHKTMEIETAEIWNNIIGSLNSMFNPVLYVGNIVFFDNFWISALILLAICLIIGGIGVFVAHYVYTKVYLNATESDAFVKHRSFEMDNFSQTKAMIKHGFFDIVHNSMYSYFYLGIAISTPVMVFFCNRLVTVVGQAELGENINFGASILVISVFMAMISSYSASALSMEGKTFYITKLVPVKFKNQLLIKGMLNFCVSFGAMVISVIILAVLNFISPLQMLYLVITELVLTIGFVLNGLNLNLFNPNLRLKANGEVDEINVIIMMIIGFFISILMGGVSIVVPFVLDANWYTYLIDGGFVLLYFVINLICFFVSSDKKYQDIEI